MSLPADKPAWGRLWRSAVIRSAIKQGGFIFLGPSPDRCRTDPHLFIIRLRPNS